MTRSVMAGLVLVKPDHDGSSSEASSRPTPNAIRALDFFRQILYDWQNLCHSSGLDESEPHVRASRHARPLASEEHKRTQRIFARLMGGESIRAIAASETSSIRRVRQLVCEELDRRDAKPADGVPADRPARAGLDLIGGLDAARGAGLQGG
jgi:hypothetical protein